MVMAALAADSEVQFDDMSVTATKTERASKEVTQSITVVGKEELNVRQMNNIQEVLAGTPGIIAENVNQGYSVNIYIRGSGIANSSYGTREIVVLRDGVPLTDPTGYSNLDYIDTQDMQQFEVVKGPGSIYSAGTTGGVIQIISKSVFDEDANRVRIGVGEHGMASANGNVGQKLDEKNAIRVNLSSRHTQNSWREYNDFQTSSASVKYGHMTDEMNPLEMELTYSNTNYWIPEGLSNTTAGWPTFAVLYSAKDKFEDYRASGKVDKTMIDKADTKEVYKKHVMYNVKYEHYQGETVYKPRFFFVAENGVSHMSGVHYSPGTQFYGVDLEMNNDHEMLGKSAKLVAGIAYRGQTDKLKNYGWKTDAPVLAGNYEDLLDERGVLASTEKSQVDQYGLYLQETLNVSENLLVDASVRIDHMNVDMTEVADGNISWDGSYDANVETKTYKTDKSMDIMAAKLGSSYALNDTMNVYGSLAQGSQLPYASQLMFNNDLKPSISRSAEIGLKGRSEKLFFDMAVYYNTVENEIVDASDTTNSENHQFKNAGETLKKGFEFAGDYKVTEEMALGASYSFNDYKYIDFSKLDSNDNDVDVSGNKFRFVPDHQYSLRAAYKDANGIYAKVQSHFFGSYYMDDENTKKYEGYKWVTNLMFSYTHKKAHQVTLNVDNLFDNHYAVKAEAGLRGDSYSPATPRTAMLFYTYNF